MANKYIQAYATEAAYNSASKPSPNVSLVYATDKLYYNGEEHQMPIDYSTKYLTFVALDNCTFRYGYRDNAKYSTDNGSTWITCSDTSFSVSAGTNVLWKANALSKVVSFVTTGRFEICGNITSLVYGDDFTQYTTIPSITEGMFSGVFSGATGLTSAENLSLPATMLTRNCYASMFKGCTSLTTAPQLPAETLAEYCYMSMFAGCTSLTTPPQLPATTLTIYCYGFMFSGCTSLTTAPELPATTLYNYCYRNMFNGCTSLTTAPELPATTLYNYCYDSMFSNCTNLNSVYCLATIPSRIPTDALKNWLNGVAATGTFTKKAGVTWPSGANGIPDGWTVVEV